MDKSIDVKLEQPKNNPVTFKREGKNIVPKLILDKLEQY